MKDKIGQRKIIMDYLIKNKNKFVNAEEVFEDINKHIKKEHIFKLHKEQIIYVQSSLVFQKVQLNE